MKVIWEASDIQAGRRYGLRGCNERWIIGYHDSSRYVSIFESDWMVTDPFTKEELAKSLTIHEYVPIELL